MRRVVTLGALVLLACVGCAPTPEPADSPASSPQPIDVTLSPGRDAAPDPPRIPHDFTWSGRYLVPDLDVDVPLTWQGVGGDFQMIAGGEDQPIHFTNLIVAGELYTLTYAWPGVPRMPCSHVGSATVDDLNAGFAEASYVGRETLHRASDHEVHHFRSVSVLDLPGGLPGADDLPLRVPIMAGDIYVDVDDPTRLRQLLHFGLQNLYDPNLDEWIMLETHANAPGTVTLPEECTAP